MTNSNPKSDDTGQGRSWAVLIGVDSYHESFGDVEYAGEDCRQLQSVLQLPEFGFDSQNILLLTDSGPADHRPTFGNIHSWLGTWLDRPGEDDTILVYFAGHGRDLDGQCYLAPGDSTLPSLKKVGIPLSEIQESLERCRARKKLLIVDACHSGAGRDVLAMSPTMESAFSDCAQTDIYTLTSCGTDEISHPMKERKQGVFSHYLVQALSGQCPTDNDGRLTLGGVYHWVKQKVEDWATEKRCKQTPRCFGDQPDTFVLGRPSKRNTPIVAEVVESRPVRVATIINPQQAVIVPPTAQAVPVKAKQATAVASATAVQQAIASPTATTNTTTSKSSTTKIVTFFIVIIATILAILALGAFAWINDENSEAPPIRYYPEIPNTMPQAGEPPSLPGIPFDPINVNNEPIGKQSEGIYNKSSRSFNNSLETLQQIVQKHDITHIRLMPLDVDTEDYIIEQNVTLALNQIVEEVAPKVRITTTAVQQDSKHSFNSPIAALYCTVFTEDVPSPYSKHGDSEPKPVMLSLELNQGDDLIWSDDWQWDDVEKH